MPANTNINTETRAHGCTHAKTNTKTRAPKDTNATKKTTRDEHKTISQTNARHPNTPAGRNRGERSGHTHEGCFFCAGACLCKYNQVGIERQDVVRSFQRCRMLALDPFSLRAKEKVDSNARTRTRGSGRQRENAVPRHWPPTCLMLITVPSHNMRTTCFILCGVLSIEALTHTSTWDGTNAHHASAPRHFAFSAC